VLRRYEHDIDLTFSDNPMTVERNNNPHKDKIISILGLPDDNQDLD
jgi:hypothetical protein